MKMVSKAESIGGIGNILAKLLSAQLSLGAKLMETLSQTRFAEAQCSCDIPEPCWMPQPLGEVLSHVRPGGAVSVRMHITNCDRVSRTITITASGDAAGLISLQPSQLALGPKERGFVVATLKAPAGAVEGQEFDALLWVKGCRHHYLRWTVAVEKSAGDSLHSVEVEDCPDLIHHWYDHFYCVRYCPQDRRSKDNHD